jgi:hypothetical protein
MTTTNQSSPDPPPQSPSTKTVTSLLSPVFLYISRLFQWKLEQENNKVGFFMS